MSEIEKDALDSQAREALDKCCREVDAMKRALGVSQRGNLLTPEGDIAEQCNPDVRAHLQGIILFLYHTLQEVTEFFGEQRITRFKQLQQSKHGHVIQ